MPKKKSSCGTVQELIGRESSGLSVLQRGDKSLMQKDFKNMGNLLPTLRFLGRLYNFCNLQFIFSLKSDILQIQK